MTSQTSIGKKNHLIRSYDGPAAASLGAPINQIIARHSRALSIALHVDSIAFIGLVRNTPIARLDHYFDCRLHQRQITAIIKICIEAEH